MLSGDLGTRSPSESLWESDLARFVVHNSSGQLLVWRGCTPEHLTPKDAEQLLAAILDELGRSAEPVEDATCVATPFEATQGWVAERKRDKDDLRRTTLDGYEIMFGWNTSRCWCWFARPVARMARRCSCSSRR
jgi:hypothetical protein